MNMEDFLKNAVPCKKCKNKPSMIEVAGVFYTQCCKCEKWSPYQFLGTTPKNSVDNWNLYNSKGYVPKSPWVED